ncbi:RNA polymerase sigma factor [Sphingobacterium faecale]|uniref:Sigma-70 family RNA polymerase sigma factor n=1 Tax=Sphingobacterium faecale TaxID=2803775 RepID=A0ABS1R9T5_9SPHI|nr:sigma-70 family RNA polymerase sigma factor [Sphingobacterium faecale]MBL1410591.1 sigma-70 family RNA polymerase sigma factor [Sphingobacterium faecale]
MGQTEIKRLMQLVEQSPVEAFNLVFEKYWEGLYRVACRKVNDNEIAKDVVQEVFIAFWDFLPRLSLCDKIEGYLYSVLRNQIFKLYEKDEVRLRYAMNYVKEEHALEESPQEKFLNRELEGVVHEEIQRMPERMQLIYQLKSKEGYTVKRIAEELGLSEQTVKNQLYNANERLRQRITKYGMLMIITGNLLLLYQSN